MSAAAVSRWKIVSLYFLSLAFVVAGFNHFKNPDFYLKMMPDYLPAHAVLVALSGAAEMILGMLLIRPETRSLAAWGLILMLAAFIPAHFHMIGVGGAEYGVSDVILWLRLPLQGVFMFWIYQHTKNGDLDRREIRTAIEIDAPIEKVWATVSDLDRYAEWNPMIIRARGEVLSGAMIEVTARREASVETSFKSLVTEAVVHRKLEWRVSLIFRGWLDVFHFYELEKLGERQTRLQQGERLEGFLVGLLAGVFGAARPTFEAANQALKKRCEM